MAASAEGIPLILSTGMTTDDGLADTIECIRTAAGTMVKIAHALQCVSTYPCPNEQLNMSSAHRIKAILSPGAPEARVGFSNHCPDIIHIIQAAVMGASMVEFHITLDRNMDGPDHRASIGPMGFKRIMDHLANIEKSWGDGKLEPSEKELAKGRHYLWR